MVVHNELPIRIKKELHNQIHLQFFIHIHSELLKPFDVLDHYQTMIMHGLPIMHLHFEMSLRDLKANHAILLTI